MANFCHEFVKSLNLPELLIHKTINLEQQVHIKSLLYRLAEIFKPGYPDATPQQLQLAAGYGYCVHQSLFLAEADSNELMLACEQALEEAIAPDNPFWGLRDQLEQQALWHESEVSQQMQQLLAGQAFDEALIEQFQQLQIRHRSYGLFFPLILQAFSVDQKITTDWCYDLIGYYLKIFGYIYDADAILEPNVSQMIDQKPPFCVIAARDLLQQAQLPDLQQDPQAVIKTVVASGIYVTLMEQAIEQCRLGNLHLDQRPDLPVTRGRMLFRAFDKKCRQQIRSVGKMYRD